MQISIDRQSNHTISNHFDQIWGVFVLKNPRRERGGAGGGVDNVLKCITAKNDYWKERIYFLGYKCNPLNFEGKKV